MLFLPVYKVNVATDLNAQAVGKIIFIPLLLIPMACISILAFVAIFLYKNRTRQMKICKIGLALSILISANAIVFPQFFLHGISKENLQVANGAYLFPVNIILFALALYFIRKDEDLVKAADRLR